MITRSLFQALLDQVKEKRNNASPFESIRKDILDFLHRTLKEISVRPTTMTFHEIRYFDQVIKERMARTEQK